MFFQPENELFYYGVIKGTCSEGYSDDRMLQNLGHANNGGEGPSVDIMRASGAAGGLLAVLELGRRAARIDGDLVAVRRMRPLVGAESRHEAPGGRLFRLVSSREVDAGGRLARLGRAAKI